MNELRQLRNARNVVHNRDADAVFLVGVEHVGLAQAVGVRLITRVDDKFFVLVVGTLDGLIKPALVGVTVVEDAGRDGRDVMNAHRHELRDH